MKQRKQEEGSESLKEYAWREKERYYEKKEIKK